MVAVAVAVAAVVVAVVAAVAVVTAAARSGVGVGRRTPVCASEFVEVYPGHGTSVYSVYNVLS